MRSRLKKANKTDIVLGLIIFCACLPFLIVMPQFVSGGASSITSPLSFPRFVIGIAVALSFLLIVAACLYPKKEERKDVDLEDDRRQALNILLYIGILFLYLGMLNNVGFMISTPIILLMVARLLQGRNFLILLPLSIFFSVGLYYVALKLMKVMLPCGVFF